MRTVYKKINYPYFYVPNHRKITINAYESMRRYKNSTILKYDWYLRCGCMLVEPC
jgi:hypothetical protein